MRRLLSWRPGWRTLIAVLVLGMLYGTRHEVVRCESGGCLVRNRWTGEIAAVPAVVQRR